MNMKHPLQCFTLVMLGIVQAAHADEAQLNYVNYLAKQINFAETHQQAVWPGFHPAQTPIVIDFDSFSLSDNELSPVYAFNFTPGQLAWQQVGSNFPIYTLPDVRLVNQKGLIDGDMMSIDGSESFIDLEYPGFTTSDNYGTYLLNSRMHYYLIHESAIDLSYSSYLTIPYDNYNDPEYVKLIYLEDAALTSSQQTDPIAAEKALQDAVAIRQYRQQQIDVSAKQYENGNDIMLGVPTYAMWASRDLNDADYRKMSQRRGCAPLSALESSPSLMYCTVYQFPLYASSVYGRALDKKLNDSNWKKQVEKQFQSIPQSALALYHFTDDQAKALALKAMENPTYRYKRIATIVDSAMHPYVDDMKLALQDYQQQTGVELRLPVVYGYIVMFIGMFEQSFDQEFIPNIQTTMLENVDIDLHGDDGTFAMAYHNLPHMILKFLPKDFNALDLYQSYTSLNLETKTVITLDGITYTAEQLVNNKLSLTGKAIEISDTHTSLKVIVPDPLTIDASQGYIKFGFEDQRDNAKFKQITSQWMKLHHVSIKDADAKKLERLPQPLKSWITH